MGKNLEELIEGIRRDKKAYVDSHVDLADFYFGAQKYEEALESLDKAIELDSENGIIWNNKGYALNDLGRYEEALESLDKAIELNPEDGIIWCNKGRTLGEIGRYEEALESLDKAIELNPEDGVIWNNKGLTHYKLGDINGAREAFLKSLDKESKYNKRGIELCYMVQTRLRFLGEKNIGNRLLDTMGSGIIDESEARKIRKTAYQKTLKMIKK